MHNDLNSHGLSWTETVICPRTDHSRGCWRLVALHTVIIWVTALLRVNSAEGVFQCRPSALPHSSSHCRRRCGCQSCFSRSAIFLVFLLFLRCLASSPVHDRVRRELLFRSVPLPSVFSVSSSSFWSLNS